MQYPYLGRSLPCRDGANVPGWQGRSSERTGGPAPNEGTLFFMGSVGYIYLGIAIANVMAMMAPASQSMVFFRAMVIITFIAALRAIGNAIIADEILTYAPLIATILVYVGYAVVMSRNKARLGTHFGWL